MKDQRPRAPASVDNIYRVYLKTHDVTGSEDFCVAQDIFSQEY